MCPKICFPYTFSDVVLQDENPKKKKKKRKKRKKKKNKECRKWLK